MDDERPGFVTVRFRLEHDDDGWPPAESEGLWAVSLGSDAYRIDNTSWFARNVAADDVFLAEPDADGRLWAGERLRWSGNCTIRVIPDIRLTRTLSRHGERRRAGCGGVRPRSRGSPLDQLPPTRTR
jgi:hypothetical protein